MRGSLLGFIPQPAYAAHLVEMNQHISEMKKSAPSWDVERFKKFQNAPMDERQNMLEAQERRTMALDIIKSRTNQIAKAGVTSALGYNFYDLRGPAYLIYPVNVPFRNMLPRWGRVNDGVGTAAHWKATTDFGTQYGGVSEGQRNAVGTPNEVDYTATYKEIGIERSNTFTSQFAGEGYTDNVADEHLRGMHQLWLQEEGLMLLGNSGTASGNNGFVLGTMNTPVAALVAGAGLADTVTVSAFCVAITGLGNPQNVQYGYGVYPTVAGGLTPSYVRSNQGGSTNLVSGGTSIVSAASNVVTTTTGNNKVSFTAAAKAGAFAYAWYVNVVDASAPSKANAFLHSITTFPTLTISAAPTGTQTAAATGLDTDYSYNQLDFDGLLTYAVKSGRFVDGAGANLTKGVGGAVVELDVDLSYLWTTYQAQPKTIWCSADAKTAIANTILASTSGYGAYRFEMQRDQQNNVLGGFVVSAYQSKFTMNAQGGDALPLRIHPMLPPGTIFYDIEDNPYPASRIPGVRGMMVQRDYYSIEWPLVDRQWPFGTYCHEVLAHYVPQISAVRCGIGGAGT